MLTLMSVHTVAPGREEEYEKIQRHLADCTWREEPETIRYEHFRGTKRGQYISILTFKDMETFLDHQMADYHDEVNWDGLFVEHEMQWLDPLQGANDLPPTDVEPLPADTSAQRRAYAAMLPAEKPSWWGAPLPA